MSVIDTLITDRTEADVAAARAFKKRILAQGLSSLTDAEKGAFLSGLKGGYNNFDMNRVESAVVYLSELLQSVPDGLKEYASGLGVAWDSFFDVPYTPSTYTFTTKTDWAHGDEPEDAELMRYLANVGAIITALEADYPALPGSMDRLDYNGANAIEQALVVLYEALLAEQARITTLLDRTAPAFIYSGELSAGEA